MRKILFILTSLVCILLTSCNRKEVYSAFHTLPSFGWEQDSILEYTLNAPDTINDYELLIILRHTERYPYQNFWMFVGEKHGNLHMHTDTIECTVADNHGRWLARGLHHHELPLLYKSHYRFPVEGEYTITIQQGMRTDCLPGIVDVGLIIQQKNEQE